MQLLHAGLDIGSTTAKVVVLDEYDRIIFSRYSRHFADIRAAVSNEMRDRFSGSRFTLAMAGSGALELAQGMDVPFTQEQIACTASIARFLPGVDVCIELGGEDAKITFFDPAGAEQRMNETCAGGTGAFLDQMATLFGTDAAGLNEMAKGYKTIYPVASGLDIPGHRQPDDKRPRLRAQDTGARRLPRRAALLPLRAAQALLRDAEAAARAVHIPRESAPLRRDGRGDKREAVRRGRRGRAAEARGAFLHLA